MTEHQMKFFQYLSALFHLIGSKHFTTYFSQFFVQLMGRTLANKRLVEIFEQKIKIRLENERISKFSGQYTWRIQ